MNNIYVKCLFIMDSQATGVFLAFMYLNENDGIDFSRSLYFPIERSSAYHGIMRKIPAGTYKILSYDIEKNNQVQQGFPATISNISVYGIKEG